MSVDCTYISIFIKNAGFATLGELMMVIDLVLVIVS